MKKRGDQSTVGPFALSSDGSPADYERSWFLDVNVHWRFYSLVSFLYSIKPWGAFTMCS
jgi:hypothetical protein